MGTLLGCIKVAATRLGITLTDYRSNIECGLKWCTYGKHWESSQLFGPDVTRGDGRQAMCKACSRKFWKTRERIREHPYRSPEKEQSCRAVNRAVKAGKLPSAATIPCQKCGHIGEDRRHQYHHHKGYAKKHWLDVIPLCTVCHYAVDHAL